MLGRCDIPVESYTRNTDLSEFIAALEREDSTRPLPMTAPSVRLILVTDNQAEHTLVMRMPHALYDGFSIPLLWRDLAALYENRPLSPAVSFTRCLAHCNSSKTAAAFGFWRRLLHGASMTYIGHGWRDGISTPDVRVEASRRMPICRPPGGIALATVLKAG